MSEIYLGLISGTSMDGVDAVCVGFGERSVELLGALTEPYEPALREELWRITAERSASLAVLGSLDSRIGDAFAGAATRLLAEADVSAAQVTALGSHGQTIWHSPESAPPFTMQLGDPSRIAAASRCAVVADFRRKDMALGGQGAPLVPAFHRWLLGRREETRVILNLGGIANVTVLQGDRVTLGCDTGPGNTLLDAWCRETLHRPMDEGGRAAARGRVNPPLLDALLEDPYFLRPAPKSSGPEYFNLGWLRRHPAAASLASDDMLATLTELTARSVSAFVKRHAPRASRLIVCGGGALNQELMRRLRTAADGWCVESSTGYGLDPRWMEACAFAWLAQARLRGWPGNVPAVTGAREEAILGGLYSPR